MEKWINIIETKLKTWLENFIKLLPNLVLAIIVFIVFFFIAKFLRRFLNNFLKKLSNNPAITGLFASILYMMILFVGLFVSLDLLHLEKTISSLLAGAGIIGLALGFAFQDLTAKFISGIFIIFRKPFEVGQIVETNGFNGTIEDIQLRSTTIRTSEGLHIMLPNKDIFQKPITNYSLSNDRRIDFSVTLPAKPNPDQLAESIRSSFKNIPELSTEKEIEMYFTDYTGDAIKLEIRCWINNSDPKNFDVAKDRIIKQVHNVLSPEENKSEGPK